MNILEIEEQLNKIHEDPHWTSKDGFVFTNFGFESMNMTKDGLVLLNYGAKTLIPYRYVIDFLLTLYSWEKRNMKNGESIQDLRSYKFLKNTNCYFSGNGYI